MRRYARAEAAFSEHSEEVGQLFATQAAIALANAETYWGAYELAEQLKTARVSRARSIKPKAFSCPSRASTQMKRSNCSFGRPSARIVSFTTSHTR